MRKILIISTTFFPDPQVPAIRMTQWCRNLPQFGWKPHVLCRYYGYDTTPEELAAKVHPEVTVEYLDKSAATDRTGRVANRADKLRTFAHKLVNPLLANQGIATIFVPDPGIIFWRQRRQQIL